MCLVVQRLSWASTGNSSIILTITKRGAHQFTAVAMRSFRCLAWKSRIPWGTWAIVPATNQWHGERKLACGTIIGKFTAPSRQAAEWSTKTTTAMVWWSVGIGEGMVVAQWWHSRSREMPQSYASVRTENSASAEHHKLNIVGRIGASWQS